MNSFFGLNVGMKALYASQAALNTINHNISNSDTDGYSRQVVSQQASAAIKTSYGMVGTGVDITTITQIRNVFLDYRYWSENSNCGEWNVKNDTLSELESLLSSSSDDDGLDAVLTSFESSLEDLSVNPDDSSSRAAVVQQGESLSQYLNNMDSYLQDLLEECNSAVKTKVDEINSLANQICQLNKQIYKSELTGDTSNDLRDQRANLVDELSAIADIDVTETTTNSGNTKFSIKLNGLSLVNHFQVNELECYEVSDGSSSDAAYSVRWRDTDQDIEFEGGEIKAYLDIANGTGTDHEYKGIPYYINELNEFARSFAKAFNEGIYSDGETYYSGHAGGVGSDDSTGIRFFTYDGLSSEEFMASGSDIDSIYENITAANISVSSDIEEDTDKIATSSESGEAENNENITELIALFEDDVFENGTPEDFINSIYTTLGVDTSFASQMSKSHANILDHIESSRTSVSGVSTDEETLNLVVYQQAYSAAAQVISTLDEVLSVTINSLGSDW